MVYGVMQEGRGVRALRDGTVKVHIRHLLRKLKFRSRLEAAVWAVEQGRRG